MAVAQRLEARNTRTISNRQAKVRKYETVSHDKFIPYGDSIQRKKHPLSTRDERCDGWCMCEARLNQERV